MKRDHGMRAGILVSIIFAVSALLGFARQIVLAAYFGTTSAADALQVALLIPNMFSSMLSEATLGVAILPVFVSHIAPRSTKEQREVIGSLFTLASLMLVPLTLLLMLTAPQLARLFAPGFSSANTQLTASLMRLMLPSVLFLGLANVATGILYAFRRFGATSASAAVLNLSIVVATIPLANRYGVFAPALGVLVGNVLQLAIQVPPLLKTGLLRSVSFKFRDEAFSAMRAMLWPILIAALFSQAANTVEKIVASFLPVGSIAALNYAEKVAGGPSRIFAMAMSVVVFPSLAEKAWDEGSEMAGTLTSGLNMAAVLTIPWLAMIVVLGKPVIELILQRGAFDAKATAMVTLPMIVYCFSEYASGVNTAVNRAFFSHHDAYTPSIVGTGLKWLGIGLAVLLIPLLSYAAIAVGTAVAANLTLVILLWRLRRKEPTLDLRYLVITVLYVVLASVIGAVASRFCYGGLVHLLGTGSMLARLGALAGAFAVGFVVYLAAALLMRIREAGDLLRRAWALLGQARPHRS